jgi:hypothetical protein
MLLSVDRLFKLYSSKKAVIFLFQTRPDWFNPGILLISFNTFPSGTSSPLGASTYASSSRSPRRYTLTTCHGQDVTARDST